MGMKKNYEAVKIKIAELVAKTKSKTITPEEAIELAEAREVVRRREAKARIKAAKAKMAQGKREALLHILDANGIDSENKLKAILQYVQDTKQELIPGKPDHIETPNLQ